jgi:hypothetical protein
VIKQTVVIIKAYHSSTTYKILSNILLSRLTPYLEEIPVDHHCGFRCRGQLLIIYSASVKYLRKKWKYNGARHQLFIDFKKAYDSVRREVLYNILIEFGIPWYCKANKMCLNTYSRVEVRKRLPDMFLMKNDLNQMLFNFPL